MLSSFLLLTISFLAANVMHGYLLYRQRDDRKRTISHHAAKSPRTQRYYIAGHIVAATSFYLFAWSFFAATPYSLLLIIVSTIGFIADIIQACIPARGKVEKYHEFFAYVMAISVIIIGVLAAFTIPQQSFASGISRLLALGLMLSIPASHLIDGKYFYRIQMISLLIFYAEMFVIYFGII